jgi:hypothetical protein
VASWPADPFAGWGWRHWEARALAGLGRCARAAGRTAEAEDRLRQALAILRRIGAAEAADISAELDALPETPDPAAATP